VVKDSLGFGETKQLQKKESRQELLRCGNGSHLGMNEGREGSSLEYSVSSLA
jgi:hypothetical protein